MKKRAFRLLAGGLGLLLGGLAYAAFCLTTGWALACPFRLITGLLCPGCGVTRVCLALLQGDWAAAWGHNPGLLAVVPLLAVLLCALGLRYLRTGDTKPTRWMNILLWVVVFWLLVWGVLRNIVF